MISFRPITQADQDFLFRVYASTREQELSVTDWSEEQKRSFLKFQFEAQHKYYQEQFSGAEFLVILRDDEPIGRLYVDYRPDEIRLIDIALLTEHRGKGIGGAIMQDILDEGRCRNFPVRIHVEKNNPAMHLYDRLGFRKLEDQGVYYLMEWSKQNRDEENR